MRRSPVLLLALVAPWLVACDVAIPNGLFGCGQPSDCPSGYFCWNRDSRCYDTAEPSCQPKSCDQVVEEFESLGITIECGSLPDGCDGSLACGLCPEGTQCGANGQSFMCGCEELMCATFGTGAECGVIPTRCGPSPGSIDCGSCFGEQVCVDHECVCPVGVDCDLGCGSCPEGEVCVDGECCAPAFPCADHECSPPGGLDDGCGGVTECPPCATDKRCELLNAGTYECLGDCSCEAAGVECGSAAVCQEPIFCGTCQQKGYEDGVRCDAGRCVCQDRFETNDEPGRAVSVCGQTAVSRCEQDFWRLELDATLHHDKDVDFYALDVLDSDTAIAAQILDGQGRYQVHLTYFCPGGESGLAECESSSDSLGGTKFCVSEDGFVGLYRSCPVSKVGTFGRVLVSVRSAGSPGRCDPYRVAILATDASSVDD